MADKMIVVGFMISLFFAYLGWIGFLYWFSYYRTLTKLVLDEYDDPIMVEGYGNHPWLANE